MCWPLGAGLTMLFMLELPCGHSARMREPYHTMRASSHDESFSWGSWLATVPTFLPVHELTSLTVGAGSSHWISFYGLVVGWPPYVESEQTCGCC